MKRGAGFAPCRGGWLAPVLALSCSGGVGDPVAMTVSPVIHGSDQRSDLFAVDDQELRELALGSSVALLPSRSLQRDDAGQTSVVAVSAAQLFNFCADEPFGEQPTAALCSGVLLSDSVIGTAGHCATLSPCASQKWVFGYAMRAAGVAPSLRDDDIYTCSSVLVSAHGSDALGNRWDYAAIALDRPVSARQRPLALSARAPEVDDPVTVVGYPAGLPLKVDGPVRVVAIRDEPRDYFSLNSDTYDRSSGSAVLDSGGGLVGIFVRGAQDYAYDDELACWRSRRLPDDVADLSTAEQASYVSAALMASSIAGSASGSAAGCNVGQGGSSSKAGYLWLLIVAFMRSRRTSKNRSKIDTR